MNGSCVGSRQVAPAARWSGYEPCPHCRRRIAVRGGRFATHKPVVRKVTFDEIDAKRKRYDDRVEEPGSERQWRGDFYERMGFEEAARVIDEQANTPRQILGVASWSSWDEIVKAYRRRALATHPDRATLNGMTVVQATEAFKRVQAAYSVLAREFRR